MDLYHLQYFRTVAHTENITKAAEALHISQPALSKIVSRVEDYVGTLLFDRVRGKLQLNDCGRLFLNRLDSMFMELNSGLDEVKAVLLGEKNQIYVAATFDSIMFVLIEQFFSDNPNTKIKHSVLPPERIKEGFIDGTLDFALMNAPPDGSGLDWNQICEEQILLATYDYSLFKGRKAISFRELKDCPIICATAGDGIRDSFDRCCENAGVSPNIVLESTELAQMGASSALQYAATLMPAHRFLQINKSGGTMHGLVLTDPPCTRKIGLVKLSARGFTEDTQRLYNHIWSYFDKLDAEVQNFIKKYS